MDADLRRKISASNNEKVNAMKNNLWEKWLVMVGVELSLFGLWMAFGSQTSLFIWLFGDPVNNTFWGAPTVDSATLNYQLWIYGVLGMVMVGWGVIIAMFAMNPFKRRERWAWQCLFWSVTVWYVPDTFISGYYEVWVNVALNSVLAAAIYLPLFATRESFFSTSGKEDFQGQVSIG